MYENKPVAWMHRSTKDISNSWSEEYNIPLYTQVPQEQIDKLVSSIALREMEIDKLKQRIMFLTNPVHHIED